MAARTGVKKKIKKRKPWPKCSEKGCTRDSVLMKRINNGNEYQHWCVKHYPVIEVPKPKATKSVTKRVAKRKVRVKK